MSEAKLRCLLILPPPDNFGGPNDRVLPSRIIASILDLVA